MTKYTLSLNVTEDDGTTIGTYEFEGNVESGESNAHKIYLAGTDATISVSQ